MERTRVKLHDSSRHLFCPSLRLFVIWFLSIWVDGYCSGGRSHTSGSKTSCGYTIRLVICLLFLRMRSLLKEDSPLPLSLSRRRARFASQSLLRYNLKRKNVRIKRISFYSKNWTMRMRTRACVLYGYIFLRILIINFNYRQQKITRALINIFISAYSIQFWSILQFFTNEKINECIYAYIRLSPTHVFNYHRLSLVEHAIISHEVGS